MDVVDAYDVVRKSITFEVGRFFSSGENLSLGKGKGFTGIRFPIYDEQTNVFKTASGLVLVLTHECDVDPENERLFNTEVLICPIINFEHLVEEYSDELQEDNLVSFLSNLGARNISRLFYLPPLPPCLEYGGVLYLNQISSTHVSAFGHDDAKPIFATTAHGLHLFEQVLENHLLRPKAERLAFSNGN